MQRGLLDEFIPAPDIRERFEILIDAPAELAYGVAHDIDMQSIPLVRAIIGMRERLTGAKPPPRRPQGIVAETLSLGWGVLREEPGRSFIGGAICQPWLADVKFRPVPPAEFAARAEPEHVKIAWTLESESLGNTRTRFASETRAVAIDEVARRRFRGYWRWARFGIVSIRWLLLPAIRREAEARWRVQSGAA